MNTRVETNYNRKTRTLTIMVNGVEIGKATTMAAAIYYAHKVKDGKSVFKEGTPGILKRVSDEIIRQARNIYNKGLID